MRTSTFPCASHPLGASAVDALEVALVADDPTTAVAPAAIPFGAGTGRASPSSNPAKNWRHAGSTDSGSRLH